MKPTFTVIAGINGAGKTSLYRILRNDFELGERINTDEIAMSLSDMPSQPEVQIHAGKIAVKKIRDCISDGISFHIETTLPGNAIPKYIQKASEHGFKTVLMFVGIDDISVALERVHKRMENGGHGIADSYILKRYASLNYSLKQVLPLCDEAFIFDNTYRLRQLAVLVNGKLVDCGTHQPYWFMSLIDSQSEHTDV